jgi:Raf kinase inhibitor-like YbhB/YbcL family protein
MFKKLAITLAAFTLPFFPMMAQSLQVASPDITHHHITQKFAFKGFGCTGRNISPALMWRQAPAGTKSFAVMVHDPDAPTGGAGFWHWVIVNIPARVHSLAQGAGNETGLLPSGAVQITNDYGAPAWGGPCPPPGETHRYVFTVYALKVKSLPLPAHASGSLTGYMIHMNTLAKASFTATYGR